MDGYELVHHEVGAHDDPPTIFREAADWLAFAPPTRIVALNWESRQYADGGDGRDVLTIVAHRRIAP